VGPRTGQDGVEKRRIIHLAGLDLQLSHYSDCAILTEIGFKFKFMEISKRD
jgi:hypothetical protein